MSVSVVTCVYGGYHHYLPQWLDSVAELRPGADEVIVACDNISQWHTRHSLDVIFVVGNATGWKYPTAGHLQTAVERATCDWVWPLGVDDTALPDALAGIENVKAEVWQMGYLDGTRKYLPPELLGHQYLSLDENPYVAASAFKRKEFCGYPDIALEDWGMWRRMAYIGCRFEPSGRAHFRYSPGNRTQFELVTEVRPKHIDEMLQSEQEWFRAL